MREEVTQIIGRLIHDCQHGTFDENLLDSIQFRIDFLCNSLVRFQHQNGSMNNELDQLLELLAQAAVVASNSRNPTSPIEVPVIVGARGRPKYQIEVNHLESLLDIGFTVPLISILLGVSQRTVERRMAQFGLRVRDRYSGISDTDLDSIVGGILQQFPTAGYNRMTGHLRARGVRVQRERIRSSMRRVNLEGVLLRSLELFTINRRRYNVGGPQSLWHIDGNHKLIR